ncbi:MAG: peptidylprolyl isomerase, partial [Actinomycetota bacterium]
VMEDTGDQAVTAAQESAELTGVEFTDEDRTVALATHQRAMLTLLVQDAVITDMIAEQGAEAAQEDIDELRQEVIDSVGSEEQLAELLAGDGLSLELFDEVLIPQQAGVVALREQLAEGQTLETRTVRHILIEDEELAQETFDEIEDGADFAELAAERSTDTGSAAQGGELPPAPRGAYVPEFEEAAWEAEIGELVGPVESQFGFHVLEVVSQDTTEAADLEPAELDQLVNPQLSELLQEAYDTVEVEIDPAYGAWDPMTRSVVEEGQVGEPAPAPTEEIPGSGAVDPAADPDPEG